MGRAILLLYRSARQPAMAEAGAQAGGADAAAEWEALAREDDNEAEETPVVDSPSISGDWLTDADGSPRATDTDWASEARHDAQDADAADQGRSWCWSRPGGRSWAAARPIRQ